MYYNNTVLWYYGNIGNSQVGGIKMVKSALASFLKEALDKIADYTKYVHLMVYTSVWALLFLILYLIGAPLFVPLLAGGIVNLLIGFLFWFLPSVLIRKRSEKGKNWKPLLSIINVGLIRYLALPCLSLFFFVLIFSSFFSFLGKDDEKPSLISKNSDFPQHKVVWSNTSIFESGVQAKQRFKELKIAAEQGDPKAQVDLALMYKKGEGVDKDYEEKVKWYRLAADQGYASAQRNLAISYSKGEGITQDYEEALKWYKLAADQGDADAQYGIAIMYENGKGIPQDYEEALKWYKLAADQGYVWAQHNLANLYYWKREGTPEDYEEAFKWSTLAAEKGDPDAQYFLGMLYLRGHGTEFDFEKGMMFNKLALDQGKTEAEFIIKEYEKDSTSAEIRKIQRLVKEWKKNHAN